jgi:hypothetical protein
LSRIDDDDGAATAGDIANVVAPPAPATTAAATGRNVVAPMNARLPISVMSHPRSLLGPTKIFAANAKK